MSDKDIKTNKKTTSSKNVKDRRITDLKLFAILSVILLVGIVLAVNIAFDSIIGKYLTFDLSSTGQNSVTGVTRDVIDNLPSGTEIRIVGLFDEPTSLANSPYEYTVPLLNDYALQSHGMITVEYINPETHPSIITELDPTNLYSLSSGVYAVCYNGKIKTIAPMDCFSFDEEAYYMYGQTIPTENLVESKFTNAINGLVNGYSTKAYIVTELGNQINGYGHSKISLILDGLGIECEELPASDSFDVPSDCDLLFIININNDISESMADKINEYINNGGKMIVAVDYGYNSNIDFANLNNVLKTMNLRLDVSLINEQDTSYLYSASNPFDSRLSITSDFQAFVPNASAVEGIFCRPVVPAGNPANYIQSAPVLQTSSVATTVIVDDFGNLQNYTNEGTYNVGMYSTFTDARGQEMYVFGTSSFTNDKYIGSTGSSDPNVVFIKSIISDMLDIKDTVIVDSKPIADYSLDTTKINSNTTTVMSFTFLAIIPMVLVIAGVVVYNKRKNL